MPPASRIASGPAATPRPWPAPSPGPYGRRRPAPRTRRGEAVDLAGPGASPPPAPLPTTHSNPLATAPVAPPPRPPASSRPPAPTRVPAAPIDPSVRACRGVGRGDHPYLVRPRRRPAAPEEVFALPREQVGAHLQEADFLLVPEHLVRPQLVEGLVHSSWLAAGRRANTLVRPWHYPIRTWSSSFRMERSCFPSTRWCVRSHRASSRCLPPRWTRRRWKTSRYPSSRIRLRRPATSRTGRWKTERPSLLRREPSRWTGQSSHLCPASRRRRSGRRSLSGRPSRRRTGRLSPWRRSRRRSGRGA